MKVLIISTYAHYASPSGPAYVVGAALNSGHTVEVFDCLFAKDLLTELENKINKFTPDVIGISIKFVHEDVIDMKVEFQTRHLDRRSKIKELVSCIKRISNAKIVLGGCGFNYYGQDWLEYLDLDYGIRGEAELSFPLYLNRLEEGGNIYNVPGCIYRKNGQIFKNPRDKIDNLDATAFPAYNLFDLNKYSKKRIPIALLTKRGCALQCNYCPYSSLEGIHYRLKSPKRVVDEIDYVLRNGNKNVLYFCDNNFNVPKKHSEEICKEIINRKLDIKWSTNLKPIGFSEDYCHLLKDAGCIEPNIGIETASEKMIKKMNPAIKIEQIKNALICLSKADLPFTYSLLFGAPGETPETISETLNLIDSLPEANMHFITIGIALWTNHQNVLEDARKDGQLKDDKELFNGAYYISPELPKDYMIEFIESLKKRKNCLYWIFKPYAE